MQFASPETSAVFIGGGLDESGSSVDVLKTITLTIMPHTECEGTLWNTLKPGWITEYSLCAVGENPRGYTRGGDSGGPLVVQLPDGSWGLVGVGNLGAGGLADAVRNRYPNVLTRASKINDWVQESIEYRLYFAHYAAGEGVDTDLILVNPSLRSSVFGRIRFFGPEGDDITAFLMPEENHEFSIPPLGTHSVSPSHDDGELIVGGAMVEMDGELTGLIRFRLDGVGMTSVQADRIPPSYRVQQLHNSSRKTQALIPVSGGGIRTGVAIFNHEEEEVFVTWYPLDPFGEERLRGSDVSIKIPAFGHFARFTDEVFSDLDSDFQGSVLVGSWGSEVTVLGIELGPNPGELSTLPIVGIQEWVWGVW